MYKLLPLIATLIALLRVPMAHAAVDPEIARVANGKSVKIVRTSGVVLRGTVQSVGRTFLVLEHLSGELLKISLRSIRRIILITQRPRAANRRRAVSSTVAKMMQRLRLWQLLKVELVSGKVVWGYLKDVRPTSLVLQTLMHKIRTVKKWDIRSITISGPPDPSRRIDRPQGAPSTCSPMCRTGFHCVAGRCVDGCNPPCAYGAVCRQNHCVQPGGQADIVARDNKGAITQLRIQALENQKKSAFGAWALEFFLGFGIGHYYSGHTGFGVVGTLAGIALWSGIGLMASAKNEDDATGGRILTGLGAGFWFLSWILAPLFVALDNYRLNKQIEGLSSGVDRPRVLPYFTVARSPAGHRSYHTGLSLTF